MPRSPIEEAAVRWAHASAAWTRELLLRQAAGALYDSSTGRICAEVTKLFNVQELALKELATLAEKEE